MDKIEYTYTGPVYIRPIGRGIVLGSVGKGEHLADILCSAIGDGDHNMEITIRVLPADGPGDMSPPKKKTFKKEDIQAAVWQETLNSPLVFEYAGKWIDKDKYQHQECILKETATGNFYRYWHVRSGSYFSDYTHSFEWEKDEIGLVQVTKGIRAIEVWLVVEDK